MKECPELSKTEYDVLRVLWKGERKTVREVHDQIKETTGWAYTTTKTTMDRMVKKGLLERRDFHGIYLYKPLVSRPAGLAKMVKFFAERVLETDASHVVSMFADSKAITAEEIEELERLIEREGEHRDD